MNRLTLRLVLAWLVVSATQVLPVAVAQPAPKWDTGVYVYDGSGNVVRMGLDEYHYDKANRLTYGTADQQRVHSGLRQEYGYDSFGNRITVRNCSTECVQRGLPAALATNHLNDGTSYNDVGAIADGPTGSPAHHYAYDPAGMLSWQTASGRTVEYVYTAGDQRIAIDSSGDWQWSVRDTSDRVALDVTSKDGSASNWTAVKDYVQDVHGFSGSASSLGRRHMHLDHLGSPRVITDDNGRQIGLHVYHAFGEALATGTETPEERLHFTGHERDDVLAGETLDYMHARFYDSAAGRFTSVDPVLGDPATPQSWNRYAYARNSPLIATDPTGEFVDLSSLTPDERNRLIKGLNDFTGNTYDVDPVTNYLVLVSVGQDSSASATAYVDGLIGSSNAYNVVATTKPGESWYNSAQNRIELDFHSFDGANYNGIDPRTFNLGSAAIHEWKHQTTGLFDTPDGQRMTATPQDYSWTGPIVDAVNVMRAERGLPTRAAYYTEPVRPTGFRGLFGIGQPRSAVRFLDPHTGRIVRVIRNVP